MLSLYGWLFVGDLLFKGGLRNFGLRCYGWRLLYLKDLYPYECAVIIRSFNWIKYQSFFKRLY